MGCIAVGMADNNAFKEMNVAYKKPWAKEITSNQLVWTVFFFF